MLFCLEFFPVPDSTHTLLILDPYVQVQPAEIEAMEKRKRAEKRKKDLAFFKIMEHTLLASLERGELIPDIPLTETKKEGAPIEPVPLAAQRVRTISSMDQVLLADLRDDGDVVKQQQQSRAVQYYSQNSQTSSSSSPDKYGRPPLPNAPKSRSSLYNELDALDASMVPDETGACSNNENTDASFQQEYTDSDLAGIHLLDAPIQTECDLSEIDNIGQPLGHTRRNTGGTIYLENTMEKPDIKATIKCVCSVFRAHILQAAENRTRRSPISVVISPLDREVFRDDYDQPRKRKDPKVPSFNEVLAFYDEFYRRSQMESDTIIMSLIYVERLIKASNGALTPMPENWRSILLSCMVLASKVWDDLSMWNIDFSNVSANTAGLTHFTLHRINDLEIALLKSLNFDVKVPASEYAKYYFLIRTMLLRSGLMKEVEQPLGKEDAYFRTLEARTDDFQDEKLVQVGRDRRTKSMDFLTRTGETPKADPICLEQLVG
jgi:hypothetical protein